MGQVAQIMNVSDVVHGAMPQFERIARANQMVVWQEESQFAIQALQKNSTLANCMPHTIENAVINVAAVGLTLNPADGYAYLVPEYVKELKQYECQLRISFKGLIKAATDSGAISWVKAELVKETDVFRYRGLNEMPLHEMNPFGERGEIIGVYCVAKTSAGEYLVDVMSKAEIDQIKASAKTDKVWNGWYGEMAKKAVIKRAAKQWPKTKQSAQLHETIKVINQHEGSDFEDDFDRLEDIANRTLELLDHKNEEGQPDPDLMGVGQVWAELSEKEQSYLWTAKTKGGFFTMDEKKVIREACTAYKESLAIEDQSEAEDEHQNV